MGSGQLAPLTHMCTHVWTCSVLLHETRVCVLVHTCGSLSALAGLGQAHPGMTQPSQAPHQLVAPVLI